MNKRLTQEFVSDRFLRVGFKLIGKYTNANERVESVCKCGNTFHPLPVQVFNGSTTSCGCKGAEKSIRIRKRKLNPILTEPEINNRLESFGSKLRLIGEFKGVEYDALYKCSCGQEKVLNSESIIKGRRKSCGCSSLFKGVGEISGVFWNVIKRSSRTKNEKGRNLEFSITQDYIWDLFLKQDRKCALTGLQLTFARDYSRNKGFQTASLDRIDSSIGYVPGNVQWVHKIINRTKGNLSDSDFLRICMKVVAYNSIDGKFIDKENGDILPFEKSKIFKNSKLGINPEYLIY